MASVKENLIAAKALINTPEKWGKEEYERGGCLCAMGAVAKAIGCDFEAKELSNSDEMDFLRKSLPSSLNSVWMYNDDPKTTHSDILSLFDRAIEAAE